VAGIEKEYQTKLEGKARKRAIHHALGYLVRSYFDQAAPHNLGAVVLKGHTYTDARGKEYPLLLFRSAVTTQAVGKCPCFESLIRAGRVRHVINLYGGTFPFRDLIEEERRLARQLGVTYLDAASSPRLLYRRLVERPEDYERNKRQAMENLAFLIRDHLLAPGGAPPKGNLYIHCGGGMHRSGMLFGVVRRCINGDPMDRIEAEYRRHSGYVSEKNPGGYEALNVRFIREFDCELLKRRQAPEQAQQAAAGQGEGGGAGRGVPSRRRPNKQGAEAGAASGREVGGGKGGRGVPSRRRPTDQ
jgi:hypothetical protein